MTIQGVVIEGDFGVERVHFSVAGDHAGINFDHRSIGLDEGAVERLKEGNGGVDLFRREAQAEGQLARLKRLEADGRIDFFLENRFRIIFGHFFDFHTAGGADHKNRRTYFAVNQNADVKLTLDVEAFFDQQTPDDAALFAGLGRDQGHAQNLSGVVQSFVGRFRELHATGLAATTGMDLGFDHDHMGAQTLGDGAGFLFFHYHFAARDRYAKFGEDRFGLIFVNLHAGSIGFRRVALNSAKISDNRNDQVYPEGESGARSGVALEMKAKCEKSIRALRKIS